jgi:hypothetical protein
MAVKFVSIVKCKITETELETDGERSQEHVVRFEVFMAVTKKNGVFWDVMLCGFRKNRRFGGT